MDELGASEAYKTEILDYEILKIHWKGNWQNARTSVYIGVLMTTFRY